MHAGWVGLGEGGKGVHTSSGLPREGDGWSGANTDPSFSLLALGVTPHLTPRDSRTHAHSHAPSAVVAGEVLRGDRIITTPYELQMETNRSCVRLCKGPKGEEAVLKHYTKKQVAKFEKFIRAQYRVHWLMDNLPSATKISLTDGSVCRLASLSFSVSSSVCVCV
jgi:hypothetical protein